MIQIGEAGAKYNKYIVDRDQYLDTARKAAKLTIPTLIPPSENSSSTKYSTPYQGLGARGLNNLASKLLLALFPPNSPFFKFAVDSATVEQMTGDKAFKAEVEKALGSMERTVQNHIESTSIRVKLFEALKHLIVSGNVLLYRPKKGAMRVYKLSNFTIKRAPDGKVLHIIIKETTSPLALSEEVRTACEVVVHDDNGDVKEVDIYTAIYFDTDKRWQVFQEINKKLVPGSEGHHPEDKTPWIPLRYSSIDNEDYGRGFIEEYLGDLISLEGLMKAIVEGSAAAAKVLMFVDPNGVTKKDDVAKAANGAILGGNAQDVSILQLEKFADFRTAKETIMKLEERLSFAFMLNTSVQRKGERVTAEEIRFVAGELEDSLGGLYSILSQELQLPLVNIFIAELEESKKLPPLPKDEIKPTIVTGLEALGRGHDLNKMSVFVDHIRSLLGQEVVNDYIDANNFITRTGTSLSIDTEGLVRSQDQVDQLQQQRLAAATMQGIAPKVAPQVADAALNPDKEESN